MNAVNWSTSATSNVDSILIVAPTSPTRLTSPIRIVPSGAFNHATVNPEPKDIVASTMRSACISKRQSEYMERHIQGPALVMDPFNVVPILLVSDETSQKKCNASPNEFCSGSVMRTVSML